jgi:3-phytase
MVRARIAGPVLAALGCAMVFPQNGSEPVLRLEPTIFTEKVSVDPDDPAIWVNPRDPGGSLVFGTNKAASPKGALVVFDLSGRTLQTVDGLDRPNNVDVTYGLNVGGRQVDITVVTERNRQRLRVFLVDTALRLKDISAGGGIPVFEGEAARSGNQDDALPMGVGLYRRPRDGAIFAIVSRKHGPAQGYLWQYRLEAGADGLVRGNKVRTFGQFSGKKEIEAVAVDSEAGYVYYADETFGIRKWHADPDHPEAARELAGFGTTGFQGDHEGIAIYKRRDGTGYIICTDQLPGHTKYRLFAREGTQQNPHDHTRQLRVVDAGLDSTDGIEITSAALGPKFPHGLFVAMNSSGLNYALIGSELIVPAPR